MREGAFSAGHKGLRPRQASVGCRTGAAEGLTLSFISSRKAINPSTSRLSAIPQIIKPVAISGRSVSHCVARSIAHSHHASPPEEHQKRDRSNTDDNRSRHRDSGRFIDVVHQVLQFQLRGYSRDRGLASHTVVGSARRRSPPATERSSLPSRRCLPNRHPRRYRLISHPLCASASSPG